MLVRSGALAFRIWTGLEAPLSVMETAVRDELNRRETVSTSNVDGKDRRRIQMEKMLIVGGTGETGSWFARYFRDRGFDISVWGPSAKTAVYASG